MKLKFYIEQKTVGYFQGSTYPSNPGRYLYEPNRGEGHAILCSLLRDGQKVRATFVDQDIEISILIEQQIFVPAFPHSCWFVDIAEIQANAKEGEAIKTEITNKRRRFLFPIEIRSASEPRH